MQLIPEKPNILSYLNALHIEDSHKGIASPRYYLFENSIYIEGLSFLIDYAIKNCISCTEKNKNKREPPKQILTYYPKQRYIMELTELPIDIKSKYVYLLNIMDHFSKFRMSYLLENKKAKNIFKNLKNALECNGYPEELGSDNGKEFKNKLIEDYLKDKNIEFIQGNPYNPRSQGVMELFHKTIKDALYSLFAGNPETFNINESLDIVIKKYNNHIHTTTKLTPNEIFYSKDEELCNQALENIKKSFKYIGTEFKNFKEKEKCLLKKNLKYKKNGIIKRQEFLYLIK